MNSWQNKGLIYFIVAVITATLCVQVYWNFKNYQSSKQQLVNDVQVSLDNAVDSYYTDLAKQTSLELIGEDFSFISRTQSKKSIKSKDTSLNLDTLHQGFTIIRSQYSDSLNISMEFPDSLSQANIFAFRDSLRKPVEALSSKIIVSFSEDSLPLKKIDSLFQLELSRKNISMDYGLTDSGMMHHADTLYPAQVNKAELSTTSRSPYFMQGNELKAHFSNITLTVLKRNLVGLLLSVILIASVIAILRYLLKIIRQQKQLAELKNDLISNITHEFKTPIATIGVAMEGILGFNKDNDLDKTKRYASISQEQLGKLHLMVEKLLETASLDSDELQLKTEEIDLSLLLPSILQNESFLNTSKNLRFKCDLESLVYKVDPFHFENALNNIVDNAVKYGGDEIELQLKKAAGNIEIIISDSGTGLSESQAKQLFEKFYRVPKGNTHDVKGFGIGLYYTKKIIEKHGGSIEVKTHPHTKFIITLPHG